MSLIADIVTVVAALIGAAFFTVGTVGLIRLPDRRSRLHALAKADTLGLGFVIMALVLQAETPGAAAKLVLIWVVALAAAATSAHLLASAESP